MKKTFRLLLPALLPSWRFFDVIAPSPRIQYAFLEPGQSTPKTWHDLQPHPEHVSFFTMLQRMFWNPGWNESLYLVSCAERLLEHPTPHSEDEIFKHISNVTPVSAQAAHMQFRLLLIERKQSGLHKYVAFQSDIRAPNRSDKQ